MAGGRHVPPLTPDERLRMAVRMSVVLDVPAQAEE